MQQVPVHKHFHNKIRKLLAVYWQQLYGKSWTLNESPLQYIEDYIVPSVVHSYYCSDCNSLAQYLDKLDYSYLDSIPEIKNILDFFFSTIRSDCLFYLQEGISVSEVLGDVHPHKSTKYRYDGNIYFGSYPDYSETIEKIASLLPSINTQCLPLHTKQDNYQKRSFIDIRIKTIHKEEVEDFYYNLGATIAFLLLLRAIDVNAENMIVNLPYPVLFDLECIFSNNIRDEDYSAINLGYFPFQDELDKSLLSGKSGKQISLLKPLISGTNEEPIIKWRGNSKMKLYNIPSLDGKLVNFIDYGSYILKGYENCKKEIIEKIDKIHFSVEECNTVVRVIIRPTRVYKMLMQKFSLPHIYKNIHSSKSYYLEELNSILPIFDVDINKKLVENEISTLQKGLIPVYYNEVHSRDIFDSTGKTVTRFNTNTSFDIFENQCNRIHSFYEAQDELINSFLTPHPYNTSTHQ